MAEIPEPPDDIDDDDANDGLDALAEAEAMYESHTSRLRAYGPLLRILVPRIGDTSRCDGQEIAVDMDVESARNLALIAIFADIRRIAGAGTTTGEGA